MRIKQTVRDLKKEDGNDKHDEVVGLFLGLKNSENLLSGFVF